MKIYEETKFPKEYFDLLSREDKLFLLNEMWEMLEHQEKIMKYFYNFFKPYGELDLGRYVISEEYKNMFPADFSIFFNDLMWQTVNFEYSYAYIKSAVSDKENNFPPIIEIAK